MPKSLVRIFSDPPPSIFFRILFCQVGVRMISYFKSWNSSSNVWYCTSDTSYTLYFLTYYYPADTSEKGNQFSFYRGLCETFSCCGSTVFVNLLRTPTVRFHFPPSAICFSGWYQWFISPRSLLICRSLSVCPEFFLGIWEKPIYGCFSCTSHINDVKSYTFIQVSMFEYE